MILENQTLLLLITPGEVININQYQKSKLCLPVCWTKHINKIVTNNKFNLSYELCWADAGSRELTPRIGQSCEYHSFHNFRDKIAKKILWLFQEMSNTCLNLQRKSEDCFRKCLHVYIKCLTLNISRVHWCERGGQETVSGTPTRKVLAKFIYPCLYGEKSPDMQQNWYVAKLAKQNWLTDLAACPMDWRWPRTALFGLIGTGRVFFQIFSFLNWADFLVV